MVTTMRDKVRVAFFHFFYSYSRRSILSSSIHSKQIISSFCKMNTSETTAQTTSDVEAILSSVDWSMVMPADAVQRPIIESAMQKVFQHLSLERKRIQARRSAAEKRWLEYVPEPGEQLRVMEGCNADEERVNAREREVLAFYKRNFPQNNAPAVIVAVNEAAAKTTGTNTGIVCETMTASLVSYVLFGFSTCPWIPPRSTSRGTAPRPTSPSLHFCNIFCTSEMSRRKKSQ
jgi:hypothetical protein